jgi:hypothetical protein
VDEPVRVVWEGADGAAIGVAGRTLDVSGTGLRLIIDAAPPGPGAPVQFEVRTMRLRGMASIRFVRRKGLKHIVGIEFLGSLRWNPSDHPVAKSAPKPGPS